MSEVQLLFLVLALLYGWECAVWLRRGTVAFGTWLGRAWWIRHPGTLAGNQRGGFILAAPLPPLGCLLTATQFPLSLSPEGALVWVKCSSPKLQLMGSIPFSTRPFSFPIRSVTEEASTSTPARRRTTPLPAFLPLHFASFLLADIAEYKLLPMDGAGMGGAFCA